MELGLRILDFGLQCAGPGQRIDCTRLVEALNRIGGCAAVCSGPARIPEKNRRTIGPRVENDGRVLGLCRVWRLVQRVHVGARLVTDVGYLPATLHAGRMSACVDRCVLVTIACADSQRATCHQIDVMFPGPVRQETVRQVTTGGTAPIAEPKIALDIASSMMQGQPCLVHRCRSVGQALTVANVFNGPAAEAHSELVGGLLDFVRLQGRFPGAPPPRTGSAESRQALQARWHRWLG